MTKTAKHRPGPWSLIESQPLISDSYHRVKEWEILDNNGNTVAYCDRESNAVLIRRAPEMAQEIEDLRAQQANLLSALEKAEHRLKVENRLTGRCSQEIEIVCAAIANAQGGK